MSRETVNQANIVDAVRLSQGGDSGIVLAFAQYEAKRIPREEFLRRLEAVEIDRQTCHESIWTTRLELGVPSGRSIEDWVWERLRARRYPSTGELLRTLVDRACRAILPSPWWTP